MVKSKKVWSVTAGFVGAAGLAALATGANTVSASTTGTVNYKTGATTVWNSPSWNHVKRYVTFGDTVQLLGKTVDHNGATWYKVGDNQWIPELYLNVDGKTAQVEAPASTASQAPASQAPASQAPASQAPASQAAPATTPAATQSANIQLYVKNVGSAVTVWATPAYGRATGQYLEGQQSVTAVAQQQANGETWYQLSNGGYVPARFVSTTPVAAAPQSTAPQSTASSAAAQPAQSAASQAPASSSAAQPSQAPASQAPASSAASSEASQAPVSQAPASSSAAESQAPAASQAPASSSATQPAQTSQAPASSAAPQAQTVQVNNTNASNNVQAQPAAYSAPVAPAATDTSRSAKVQAVIAVAEQQIGKPYIWGGKGPTGFDCSGLMYYAFLHGAGVNIGGWTVPQESSGTQVSLDALQPGDLLFWGSHGSTYHVALYIGGGTMIQAPQPGENVKYTAVQYFTPDFAVRPNL
ncbi:cell wall-associated glycoside hydrolase (NLP P60 protein) [Lacticaseibacillus zeae DSM 20178 = KCTC 3804]|uniref:Glycoside hydrolase n=2 Tax=Lacticaseibacillus zeae TaxID=57037 RepID=A0A5R8LYT1_LACZE|nr:cell wall hydrolase P75 [Lacticaseibacillus zeae]KRK12399.1 cell wall-associated glycoside hydrolase (NLP P60 protein) [Lacticaseibacillus zeae DSM 20178 = KCTC 3804]TLF42545.1 glycoside hydrolase [Lacticaseibacillus zeae]